jgi:uncharacterized protein YoxC
VKEMSETVKEMSETVKDMSETAKEKSETVKEKSEKRCVISVNDVFKGGYLCEEGM